MKRLDGFTLVKHAREFRTEEKGATAIEFAIVGIPFFLLVFAIIESALFFFATQYLESTVDEVTRLFRTGNLDETTTEAEFRNEFCKRLTVLLNCSEVSTDVKVAESFKNLEDPQAPDSSGNLPENSFVPPGALEIIQVSAQAKWPVFTNFAAPMLHTPKGTYALIKVLAVTRTEPYS